MPFPGTRDVIGSALSLEARLPAPLGTFARLAFNYRWSWLAGGPALFEAIDPHRWELCGANPVRLLQETSTPALERAARDRSLLKRAASVDDCVAGDLARPFLPTGSLSPERPIVFLCAEFGVHGSLPIYAGGLGVLAGDLLKAASDRAVPLVAVGLLYRRGYFRQQLDPSGWQHEYWVETDPERLPMALVSDDRGHPLTVSLPLRDRLVHVQIWRTDIGRVPLYLLDAQRPENRRHDRWITAQLYHGSRCLRLAQYLLLGAGGVRALRAMGIEPGVLHLNEGHAALAPLELARPALARGVPLEAALAEAGARTIFTTHTPVAAGNDVYQRAEVGESLGAWLAELGVDAEQLIALGRVDPAARDEPLGTTPLGMRLARSRNGVSRRHGDVSRRMWSGLWPERSSETAPIAHVTNGVHVATWMAPPMQALLARHLGARFLARTADPATWEGVGAIPDEALWAVRNRLRADLVAYVRERSVEDRLARNEPHDYVEAAARTFDPRVLTIGFARRLASYKRLHLLAADPERARRILAGPRPVQLVLAGKAHPDDEPAKRLVQGLFGVKAWPGVGQRVAFLHDYDLPMALELVRGCDLWINVPRPPLEASGTSGMKSVLNGGLQLSVLDGWWAEAWDGRNGWAIPGEVEADAAAQDARDGEMLFRLLEEEVIPAFYERDADGLPRAWLARIKASLRTIAPAMSAERMVDDYRGRAWAGEDA